VRLRRARFADLIDRQLDLFERENRSEVNGGTKIPAAFLRVEVAR